VLSTEPRCPHRAGAVAIHPCPKAIPSASPPTAESRGVVRGRTEVGQVLLVHLCLTPVETQQPHAKAGCRESHGAGEGRDGQTGLKVDGGSRHTLSQSGTVRRRKSAHNSSHADALTRRMFSRPLKQSGMPTMLIFRSRLRVLLGGAVRHHQTLGGEARTRLRRTMLSP
jgi:hypothetical protein